MSEVRVQGAALLAMLLALPLISWGTTSDVLIATVIGAVLVVAGAASLTAIRFIDTEEPA